MTEWSVLIEAVGSVQDPDRVPDELMDALEPFGVVVGMTDTKCSVRLAMEADSPENAVKLSWNEMRPFLAGQWTVVHVEVTEWHTFASAMPVVDQ